MFSVTLNPGFALIVGALLTIASPQALRSFVMAIAGFAGLFLLLTPDFGAYNSFGQIGLTIVPLTLDAINQIFGIAFIASVILLAVAANVRRDRAEDAALMLMAGSATSALFLGDVLSFVAASALAGLAATWVVFASPREGADGAGVRLLVWRGLESLLLLAGLALHLSTGGKNDMLVRHGCRQARRWNDPGRASHPRRRAFGARLVQGCSVACLARGRGRDWRLFQHDRRLRAGASVSSRVYPRLCWAGHDGARRFLFLSRGRYPPRRGVRADCANRILPHPHWARRAFGARRRRRARLHADPGVLVLCVRGGGVDRQVRRCGARGPTRQSQARARQRVLDVPRRFCGGGRAWAWGLCLVRRCARSRSAMAGSLDLARRLTDVGMPGGQYWRAARAGALCAEHLAEKPELGDAPFPLLLAAALAAFFCFAVSLRPDWLYQLAPARFSFAPYALDRLAPQIQLISGGVALFVAASALGLALRPSGRRFLDFDALFRGPVSSSGRWCGVVMLRLYGAGQAAIAKLLERAGQALARFARSCDQPYADAPAGVWQLMSICALLLLILFVPA